VLCITVRMPAAGIALPAGTARARMLASGALLIAYWAILPSVGYTLSTAVVSIGLYRGMGGYRWSIAVAAAAITTVALHLLFRVWLRQPLPGGWLGV
jgi:Tripartite tricarboxylate transporter TctB family